MQKSQTKDGNKVKSERHQVNQEPVASKVFFTTRMAITRELPCPLGG